MSIEEFFTQMSKEGPKPSIRRYRDTHAIDPIHGGKFFNRCRYCGISIHPIKGGWRHDPSEVGELARNTPVEDW